MKMIPPSCYGMCVKGPEERLPLRGGGLLGRQRWGARCVSRSHPDFKDPLQRCNRDVERVRLQGGAH